MRAKAQFPSCFDIVSIYLQFLTIYSYNSLLFASPRYTQYIVSKREPREVFDNNTTDAKTCMDFENCVHYFKSFFISRPQSSQIPVCTLLGQILDDITDLESFIIYFHLLKKQFILIQVYLIEELKYCICFCQYTYQYKYIYIMVLEKKKHSNGKVYRYKYRNTIIFVFPLEIFNKVQKQIITK